MYVLICNSWFLLYVKRQMPTDVCLILIMQKCLHLHIFSCPKTFGRQIAQPDIDPRSKAIVLMNFYRLQLVIKASFSGYLKRKQKKSSFHPSSIFLVLILSFFLSSWYSTFFVNSLPTCVIESLPRSKKQYRSSILRLERSYETLCNVKLETRRNDQNLAS